MTLDYRGNIGVILLNAGKNDYKIKVGSQIAQMIVEKIFLPNVQEVEDLDVTKRRVDGGLWREIEEAIWVMNDKSKDNNATAC